jgi:hypothetical protein
MNIRAGILIQLILTLSPVICLSQDGKVDSLKKELRRTNLTVKSLRDQADRLQYLLAAKEMALRSIELQDCEFQALVAIQAYKFNRDHRGNPADVDIYRALYRALERFTDPMTQRLPKEVDPKNKDLTTQTEAMANQLCSKVKRNMKVEEWNRFSGHLIYEATCGSL